MKQRLIFYFIIILALTLFSGCLEERVVISPEGDSGGDDEESPEYTILFIGSSYTLYNDLPGIFEKIAVAGGKIVYTDEALYGGRRLDELCRDPEVISKIKQYDWDFVILQGSGMALAYPEYTSNDVWYAIETFQDIIYSNNPDSKPVYFMPWAFKDGMTWVEGYTDTYEEMQQKIYDATMDLIADFDIMVAPVGQAWLSLYEQKTGIELFAHDMNHPTLAGSYLSACVIYSTIYVESCEGNKHTAQLPSWDASVMQETASDEVLLNLETYNIPTP